MPTPTKELVVSILKSPELMLKAVAEEVRVAATYPEGAGRDKAPVVRGKPFEAVKRPS